MADGPKIEKGIPIPAGTSKHGGMISLLRSMDVGDSVYFEGHSTNHAGALFNSLRAQSETRDHKFISRTVNGGVRIWRIK